VISWGGGHKGGLGGAFALPACMLKKALGIILIQLRLSRENRQTFTSKREKHYYCEIVYAYMSAHLC
jgi:hypothetical protein